jgi:hypothetical protein
VAEKHALEDLAIRAAVLRLSLEKLDKVRVHAAQCWYSDSREDREVSSEDYFMSALQLLNSNSTPVSDKRALLEGYISSAGMGSESIVQAARFTLYDFLDCAPLEPSSDPSGSKSYTLLETSDIIADILRDNLGDDRVLVPLLEVIAFLLDTQLLQRLSATNFK